MRKAYIIVLALSTFLFFIGCADKVEKSDKQYKKGVDALQEGKTDDAKKLFKKAITTNPDNARALFQLGIIHSRIPENIEIAISYLKQSTDIFPKNEVAHYTLASLYGEKGLVEYEISELLKTIAINNDNDGAHYNLGVIYAQKGLYDEALVEFNEVLRINPKDTGAMLNTGIAYLRKGEKDKAIGVRDKLKGMNEKLADTLTKLLDQIK